MENEMRIFLNKYITYMEIILVFVGKYSANHMVVFCFLLKRVNTHARWTLLAAVKLCASHSHHDGVHPRESPICHNICRVDVLELLDFQKFEETESEKETENILYQDGAPKHFSPKIRHALNVKFPKS
jgi:hypothetical protein